VCFVIVDTCRNETFARAPDLTNFLREDRRRNHGDLVGVRRFRRAGDCPPPLFRDNDNVSGFGSAAAGVSDRRASAEPSFDLDRAMGTGALLDPAVFHETYGFILDRQVAAGLRRDVAVSALLRGIGESAVRDCC
jgi:hypothetical protein